MITKLLARPMLAAPFIAEGVDAVRRPKKYAEKFSTLEPTLTKLGLPPVLASDAELMARLTGGITAIAGLCLATGRKPRAAALTLAALNLPLTITSNPVWQAHGSEQRNEYSTALMKGAGIAGGLIYAAQDRGGKPSLGWRYSNWRDQRAELRETKAKMKSRYTDDA